MTEPVTLKEAAAQKESEMIYPTTPNPHIRGRWANSNDNRCPVVVPMNIGSHRCERTIREPHDHPLGSQVKDER